MGADPISLLIIPINERRLARQESAFSPMSLPFAPDVSALFGPMLLGVFLNTLLFGVMLVQVSLYFQRYKNDRPWFKYLVLYLVVAEGVNWICDVGLIYEPLILRFGSPLALKFTPVQMPVLPADSAVTVLVSTPIQLFMAWRVHIVTHSRILPGTIILLAFISFAAGLATSTVISLHPTFEAFPSFRPEIITWLVFSAACDVFLTAALVYSLWIRKTNVESTDSLINKVIRLTVQTGTITAVGALADLFLTFIFPTTTVNFIIAFPLTKLYSVSLVGTLNARPWNEKDTTVQPNVLFEPTPMMSSSSFVLTGPQTRSTSLSQLQSRMRQDSITKSPLDGDSHV
ncbi:hypothetical protein B0H16DRAFT_726852 [Mycena metata]|uniref:DUF6534 domain-containing protein n=1 Tax=Mycena metata TaxID=1033252 RepID=A0AAD7K9L7_9AGAR|nr:hypothetical protein B0H16DRAFT_726852 [Mycena metata]